MRREYIYAEINWHKECHFSDLDKKRNQVGELLRFVNIMNQGPLDKLVASHLKGKRQPPTGEFLFAPPFIGSGYHLLPPDQFDSPRYCYMGGTYGFLIGFQEENSKFPIWLSLTSFHCFSHNQANLLQSQSYPLIVQLQGCTNQGDLPARRELVRKIFYYHDWTAPVSAVIRLGQYLQMPKVEIESVARKDSHQLESMNHKKAEERYDGTAQRCGFNQEVINGYYVLHLDYQGEKIPELKMAS